MEAESGQRRINCRIERSNYNFDYFDLNIRNYVSLGTKTPGTVGGGGDACYLAFEGGANEGGAWDHVGWQLDFLYSTF